MAFEASAFDLLNKSEWSQPKLLSDKINHRLFSLANELDLCNDRLLAWIFLRVITSVDWFIQAKRAPDEMLRLADILYPILNAVKFCEEL